MPSTKRIVVGSDHAGLELKRLLATELEGRGYSILDVGTHSTESCDYPDFAQALSRAIQTGDAELGVLVCGTGVGMAIAANRSAAVRAVVCSEALSARLSRQHNDANVLCLGARVIGVDTARDVLDAFLSAKFEGGRHQRRIDKLSAG